MLGEEIDPFKTEKRQIILRLGNYENDVIVSRVAACLRDYDEGVRYAAVETRETEPTAHTQPIGRSPWEFRRRIQSSSDPTGRNHCAKHDWSLGEMSEDIVVRPITVNRPKRENGRAQHLKQHYQMYTFSS